MAVTTEAAGRPAVFLDKDGTLLKNVPYNIEPTRMELMPGAVAALATLQERGFLLVVVSNQSGVARGLITEHEVASAADHLAAVLAEHGIALDGFYHCPHLKEGSVARYAVACRCRKPRPGLLLRAAEDLDLDLGSSWMVGDILDDVEAGARAGCRTILVDTGGETEWRDGEHRDPDHIVGDLKSAASTITSSMQREAPA